MRTTTNSRRSILAASALALLTPSVSAAILDEYTFGDTWPSVFTPTTVAEGISATAITGSAGVILDGANQETALPTPWLRVAPLAANPTPEAAILADASFQFTLTALPGFTMTLSSMTFQYTRGGGTTPRGYALQSSADGFGSIISTAEATTARPSVSDANVDLSGASYQGLSGITFKMFSYSPAAHASMDYDNIVVNGTSTFNGYTWQGTVNGDWDTATANWTGTGATYVDNTAASNVLFNNAGTASTVNVAAGGMNPNLITFTNGADKSYTFNGGDLNVATSLYKSGDGMVTFNNSVTAESVTVESGIDGIGMLEMGDGSSLSATDVTVSHRGTLMISANSTFNATNLAVNGSITASSDIKVQTLTGGSTGILGLFDSSLEVTGTSTYGGTIDGTGSLLKSTDGVLTLTGANRYSGGTTITGGAIQLSHVSAAGSGAISVETGGVLSVGAAIANEIILDGGVLGFSATLGNLPANLTVNSDSTIKSYNPITEANSASEVVVTGMLQGSGDINLLSLNGDNPDGGVAFRLRGLLSTGENAYSGTITVNPSVKFEVQTGVESGSPMGTGKLVMVGGMMTGGVNGTYSLINVRNNFTGSTTLGNDVSIAGTGAAYFNLLGSAPAGSAMNFGKLTVGDGQTVAAVATNSNQFTLAFSSVELTGGIATFTPHPVGNTTFTSTQNISLGTISEAVGVEDAGIRMNGAATLTLTGNNTYTGPTYVESGTLVVNGSIAGSTTELTGGTLRGAGTTGAVNVNGGTLAPGNGIGSLNTGAVAFQAGTLALEIGGSGEGSYDQLKVAGGLAFNAPITLTLDFGTYDPVDGESFTLVSNDGVDAISFADANSGFLYNSVLLTEGMMFTATSGAFTQEFTISYVGGTGNDVVLTAVPEPGTVAALLGGVAMLASVRRRRR